MYSRHDRPWTRDSKEVAKETQVLYMLTMRCGRRREASCSSSHRSVSMRPHLHPAVANSDGQIPAKFWIGPTALVPQQLLGRTAATIILWLSDRIPAQACELGVLHDHPRPATIIVSGCLLQ